ncbi:MAG: FadR family transcriptional regulator [Betaproteobacteria bacterium]|nr:MAG: FadR family transcriptional regulator [Betaproteobacteria bacterium]
MLSDNQTLSTVLPHVARALADAGLAAHGGNGISAIDRPSSLADEAYGRLSLQLDMNLWKVGEKLPTEMALAESLGVSRPVIREALARLRADGRIETRQGAGAFVADRNKLAAFRMVAQAKHQSDAEAEREVLELRQIVEAGAAELAAQRRNDADLIAIRAALEGMHSALEQRTDGSVDDDAFHSAIAHASHNSQIAKFVEFLGAQFSDSRKATWDDIGYGVGIATVGQSDHAAIYKAIAAGDGAKAKRMSHSHVQRAIDRIDQRIATEKSTKGNV